MLLLLSLRVEQLLQFSRVDLFWFTAFNNVTTLYLVRNERERERKKERERATEKPLDILNKRIHRIFDENKAYKTRWHGDDDVEMFERGKTKHD